MYQYTDCYLDNIWLINGYTLTTSTDGQTVKIEDIDGLHEMMMNLEVGSILKVGESFYFAYTDNGWHLATKKDLDRRVA